MGSVNFEFEAVYPYSLFYIFLISSMVFVTLFKSRFHSFIKAVDPKKAPFTKKLSESEQEILKYFPKYFVYHLLVWAINDGLVIVAFVVSYLTKNYSYLFISSLFAITFNLLKAKPNYLKFCRDKTYYGK